MYQGRIGVQRCRTATERQHDSMLPLTTANETLSNPDSILFYPRCRDVVPLLSIDGTRDGTLVRLALNSRQNTPHATVLTGTKLWIKTEN